MPASGSAKPSEPPAPGDPNELALPNGQRRARLHEAERELHAVALQAFVVEPARRRNRRRGQQVQRLRPQPQLASAGGEDAVGVRDRSRRADGAAGRHFEVARVDVLLVDDGNSEPLERPVDLGARIHRVQREAKREAAAASRSAPGGAIVARREFGISSGSRM